MGGGRKGFSTTTETLLPPRPEPCLKWKFFWPYFDDLGITTYTVSGGMELASEFHCCFGTARNGLELLAAVLLIPRFLL
jgi:hypothetical protein